MKIRLCEHNQGAEKLFQRLQTNYPDLNSKLKKCVKQCKICKRQPFIMADKQPILASNVDELYDSVVLLFEQDKQVVK